MADYGGMDIRSSGSCYGGSHLYQPYLRAGADLWHDYADWRPDFGACVYYEHAGYTVSGEGAGDLPVRQYRYNCDYRYASAVLRSLEYFQYGKFVSDEFGTLRRFSWLGDWYGSFDHSIFRL